MNKVKQQQWPKINELFKLKKHDENKRFVVLETIGFKKNNPLVSYCEISEDDSKDSYVFKTEFIKFNKSFESVGMLEIKPSESEKVFNEAAEELINS